MMLPGVNRLLRRAAFLSVFYHCAAVCSEAPPTLNHRLLASYDFESPGQLSDWHMEGPGQIAISDGRMLLASRYQQKLQQSLPAELLENDRTAVSESVLRPYLLPLVRAFNPEELQHYRPGSPIRFSHFVLWNTDPLPDNFAIEYDLEADNPYPLHMLHFSAAGLTGESIFADHLALRRGIARQYMYGDIATYRISYYSGSRNTINIRKAPGRQMLASVRDSSAMQAGQVYRARLIKWRGNIRFYLDDRLLMDINDKEPLGGGYWGLRLMVMAKCYYDNIRLYALSTE